MSVAVVCADCGYRPIVTAEPGDAGGWRFAHRTRRGRAVPVRDPGADPLKEGITLACARCRDTFRVADPARLWPLLDTAAAASVPLPLHVIRRALDPRN